MNAARQVVHILAKDIRGHALEIGLVLVLNLVLALTLTVTWEEMQVRDNPNSSAVLVGNAAQFLLLVAWVSLIGRVVQGDGVAGKVPSWLTRPYSRAALLASKLVFVLLFMHVPSFLSQLVIVAGSGVPLSLPQLLGNQALLAACLSLPLTAIAALTTTFRHFVSAGVVVIVFQLYVYGAILDGSDTLMITTALAILALIAGVALACQYCWRSTLRVAAWSLVALSLLGLGALTRPFTYGYVWRARAALIGPPTVPPTIRLLDPSEQDERYPPPFVSLPIDAPFSDDTIFRHFEIEVHSAAGREVDLVGWGGRLRSTNESFDWLDLQLSPTDYDTLKDSLVSVRLVVEIEGYENREMEPIPLDGSFAIVGGRAQCGTSNPFTIVCRSSFGRGYWWLDASRTEARFRWSPVRLSFVLNPIESEQFGTFPQIPFAGPSIATVLREPASHTWQDVTFENIRLSDWAQ